MNKHSDTGREEALMRAARAQLEHDAARLDAVSVARLRSARARALDAKTSPRQFPGWLPAGAVALVIATTAVVLLIPQPATDGTAAMMSTLDDNYELYENLEFYEWLEADTDEKSV